MNSTETYLRKKPFDKNRYYRQKQSYSHWTLRKLWIIVSLCACVTVYVSMWVYGFAYVCLRVCMTVDGRRPAQGPDRMRAELSAAVLVVHTNTHKLKRAARVRSKCLSLSFSLSLIHTHTQPPSNSQPDQQCHWRTWWEGLAGGERVRVSLSAVQRADCMLYFLNKTLSASLPPCNQRCVCLLLWSIFIFHLRFCDLKDSLLIRISLKDLEQDLFCLCFFLHCQYIRSIYSIHIH